MMKMINWSLGGLIGQFDFGLVNSCDDYWKKYCNKNTHQKFKNIWSNAKNNVQWKGK